MSKHECPQCGERIVKRAPRAFGQPWSAPGIAPERMRWSHADGQPLCPVMTSKGYQPALPDGS